MKKVFSKINNEVYYEKLENGLDVYVVPLNFKEVYATFSTKYGSTQSEFKPHGEEEFVKVTDGIAHFLEHKMFEQVNREEPFAFFAKNGVSANANTSHTKTTYLFYGIEEFESNMNFLLDYVQDPYFTDENVNKEKGIIEQEIKMYDDDPGSILSDKLFANAFVSSPYKIPILGLKEDIYSLTKEDLYLCYNTFYHPSNMFVVISGGVDPKEAIEIVRKNQAGKSYEIKPTIRNKEIVEEDEVAIKEETFDMGLVIPKIGINFKINTKKSDLSEMKKRFYLSMFLNLKFGSISDFYEKVKKENLINGSIYKSMYPAISHEMLIIDAESRTPELFLEEIIKEIPLINFKEKDFDRKKKVIYSDFISMGDNIYNLNSRIMDDIINYGEVRYDVLDRVDELNYNEMVEFIKSIDFSNYNYVIVK